VQGLFVFIVETNITLILPFHLQKFNKVNEERKKQNPARELKKDIIFLVSLYRVM
jgi:hypothetical protein